MGLSNVSFGYLEAGVGNAKAADEINSLLGVGVPRTAWYVSSVFGSDTANDGLSWASALGTISTAVSRASSGDCIYVGPGQYDETVTIARAKSKLSIVGVGGRGAAYIEPSTEDAAGMVCHADDVTLVNIGVAAEDDTSAVALTVTGSRFRAYACKIEAGADQLVIGPGTVAQEAAGTHGVGADWLFEDCEFCWGTDGIVLTCTDYGAVTQGRISRCHFHNLSGKHITEAVGSGGSAAVTFQNIVIEDCTFDDLDVGTAPTNYIDLNADNANTGVVTGCRFPTAINSGLNLVSTAMHWVSNFHTGGVSTAQPS